MRLEIVPLLVIALCFLGCASAYDQTYDRELGRLRNEEQGVPYDHIHPAGFSSNFPDEPDESAHGRSRNRRVEVRVR